MMSCRLAYRLIDGRRPWSSRSSAAAVVLTALVLENSASRCSVLRRSRRVPTDRMGSTSNPTPFRRRVIVAREK